MLRRTRRRWSHVTGKDSVKREMKKKNWIEFGSSLMSYGLLGSEVT